MPLGSSGTCSLAQAKLFVCGHGLYAIDPAAAAGSISAAAASVAVSAVSLPLDRCIPWNLLAARPARAARLPVALDGLGRRDSVIAMAGKREALVADGAPAAIGPYSHAVRTGELLFCSGQIPLDPVSGELVGA